MSIAYQNRKRAIAAAKRTNPEWCNGIPLKDFRYMQANWERQITGPPLGTLADFLSSDRVRDDFRTVSRDKSYDSFRRG